MADNSYTERPDVRNVIKNKTQNISFVSGVGNKFRDQTKPRYQSTNSEKIIDGTSNCMIVLGNDRPAGVMSGRGGVGDTGAACIDIIVGLAGPRPVESVGPNIIPTQKDFKNDSARIYISKKCNLDEYFDIPSIGVKLTDSSQVILERVNDTAGVGIKADHIRVIGRENIKLVTNHAGVKDNCSKVSMDGIYLIAGYDMLKVDKKYALEPMVRGNKLAKFLEKMLDNLQNVQGNLNNFIKQQNNINEVLLNHKHISNAAGHPTDGILGNPIKPNIIEVMTKTIPDSIYNTVKNELIKQYLQSGSPDYINSLWHKLN